MRRQSYAQCMHSSNEPQIIVEETNTGEEEFIRSGNESPPRCLDPDSPSLNPYLLSPWRETRKHSLPTPQCTSGITASQVRRLSERGGEGSGPSSREAAFLATLSSAPTPQPGGRRHSVVTISKVPTAFFGRGRRESIAALPTGSTRILPIRRDSITTGPPSNSGSTHNLQLDIMDDIAEIKARKVRLKMWKTPSRERVCEVQTLEGNNCSTQRYVQQGQRRYSDLSIISTNQMASNSSRRRASEMPHTSGTISPGIVCSNTDLISILSSLTSSANEINYCNNDDVLINHDDYNKTTKTIEQKRKNLKNFRSNSFDISILNDTFDNNKKIDNNIIKKFNYQQQQAPSNWFTNRHQPLWKKQKSIDVNNIQTTNIKIDKSKLIQVVKDTLVKTTVTATATTTTSSSSSTTTSTAPLSSSSSSKELIRHKVVWDDKSGTKVDAQVLGTAIEEFLTSQRSNDVSTSINTKTTISSGKQKTNKVTSWFVGNNNNKEDEKTEPCEPSICSSLKDLFVK
ncbi:hypothetical protein HCN44_000678 [Aphidius gifuensis]|uniref:Uncharacterized protein n=1 Tax=Aphidius gifuensis TaxID=684658 RepID=A0A835CR45_APHGI|nr:uncharacterized protein LOC122854817 [Aphidius gifuensis]XP_044011739.1 uncharacterized protein LOC122854817 [Aphidius gifuensis]XP_044011740.1 uncharacterized protein LOC122854817 [Aphidius gifuensis]KAF7990873.1 hypothetical protein HCN44_000678 [Aphidius gifuensis]